MNAIATLAFWTGLSLSLWSAGARAEETKVQLSVQQMTCAACPYIIETALKKLDGVSRADAELSTQWVVVTYDDSVTTPDVFAQALDAIGFRTVIRW